MATSMESVVAFTCQFCGSCSNKQHRNDTVCWSCYKYAHDRHLFPSLWTVGGVAQALASLFLSQPVQALAESEQICRTHRNEVLDWLQVDVNREKLEVKVPELCNPKYRKILPYLVRYVTGDPGEKGDIRKSLGTFTPLAAGDISFSSSSSKSPTDSDSSVDAMPPTARGSAPSGKGKRKRKPYAELTAEQKARRVEAVQRCRRKKADKKTTECSAAAMAFRTDSNMPNSADYPATRCTSSSSVVRGIARGQRKIMRVGAIFAEFIVSDPANIADLEQQFRTALTVIGRIAVEQKYPLHCLPKFSIGPKEARIRSQRFSSDRIFVKVVIELDGDADLRDNRDRGLAFKDSLYTLQRLTKDDWMGYRHLLSNETASLVEEMLQGIEVDIDGRSIPSRDAKPLWLCAWCHHFRLRKNTLSVCESCYKQANTHFPRIWDSVTSAIRDAMPQALKHSEHLDLALQILWPNMSSQKQELVSKIEPRLRNELTTKQTEILYELIEYTLTPRPARAELLKAQPWQYYYGRMGVEASQ